MRTKQTIAVIGATGKMGSAISKSISRGNYRILLCSHEKNEVEELLNEIRTANSFADVEAVNCSTEASWEADIIISAVSYDSEKQVADNIKQVANQKIVVSISNISGNTFNGIPTSSYTSAAEELQMQLPYSKVVKAFNTFHPEDFFEPSFGVRKLDAFIAGNHEEALQTVSELVSIAGFNPIIAGDLSVSRTLEKIAVPESSSYEIINYN
ncbi:MAG: NADPH-dependent F420 reductase [Flavisolibacter sp.]